MHPDTELMAGTLFEGATEPAYVMDPGESCIVAVNDAGCALLGYTRDELLATPIAQIHPSESVELSALLERVLRDGPRTGRKSSCPPRWTRCWSRARSSCATGAPRRSR